MMIFEFRPLLKPKGGGVQCIIFAECQRSWMKKKALLRRLIFLKKRKEKEGKISNFYSKQD